VSAAITFADVAKRRAAEQACALDFLVYGDDEERGRHATRCVCSPTCSRDYDPIPYDEAEPTDLGLYEGTAIGALYGLCPATTSHVVTDDDGRTYVVQSSLLDGLQGWNIRPRTAYE
jgi:hypothetical protein